MTFFELTDCCKMSDIYINHNNCLGHMLITVIIKFIQGVL